MPAFALIRRRFIATFISILIVIGLTTFFPTSFSPLSLAHAQTNNQTGALGLGVQVGSPTGLTLKYYPRKDFGLIVLGSWSLERFLLFSMHMTYEHPIPDSPLRFFFGPGMEIGREGNVENSDIKIGASTIAGLNFFTEKFEVFLHALPGIKLAPTTRLTIGGAVGLRYFF